MSRAELMTILRRWIDAWEISPWTAGVILEQADTTFPRGEEIDPETIGDYLDGQGHPELAERMYALVVRS